MQIKGRNSLVNTFFLALIVSLFAYCNAFTQSNYQAEINAWHNNRIENLKSPNGWLNLIALEWLKPGKNSIGSDSSCTISKNIANWDSLIGTFTLGAGEVVFKSAKNIPVYFGKQEIKSVKIFDFETEDNLELTYKNYKFIIIKRGEKIGLRIRDLESPQMQKDLQIDRFTVDETYKIMASLSKTDTTNFIAVDNVIGQTTQTPFAGMLKFTLKNQEFQLAAFDEGEDLFIVFADNTSGTETYGGGRFLYAKKPKMGELVELDFNKSYNPPCVFTNFATCPLPPKINFLNIKIEAGEKTVPKN
ncbi:MAG: DUF1684 domain-containing protein [Bacteroidota bacterium]